MIAIWCVRCACRGHILNSLEYAEVEMTQASLLVRFDASAGKTGIACSAGGGYATELV